MAASTATCESSMDGALTGMTAPEDSAPGEAVDSVGAVDAVESASKRRRLDDSEGESAPCEESVASNAEPLALAEHILQHAPETELHHQPPAQPEPAVLEPAIVQSATVEASLNGSPSSISAPPEGAQDGSAPPKPVYPCRTAGCGARLSSTSNRRRHERKHEVGVESTRPALAQSDPVHLPLAAIPRRSVKRSAAVLTYMPRSPVVQPVVVSRKHSPTADALRSFADVEEESEDTESKDEEEDLELLRFLGSSLPASQHRSFSRRVTAASPFIDEGKSCAPDVMMPGPRSDSSGSDASRMDDDVSTEDEPVPGMPLLLSDAELQSECYGFLTWLTHPPLTQFESQVKLKRVSTMAALQPIRCNLRFIFTLLSSKQVTSKADLHQLTSLETCQILFDALAERGVGSARTHSIGLLVKKCLVFLATSESTAKRQFLPPTRYDSFLFVDGICCANSLRRKQESRNRALLGLHASKQLAQGNAHQRTQPFAIPTTWSSNAPSGPTGCRSGVSPASLPASLAPPASSCNELSKEELQLVTKGCLASLRELMASPSSDDSEAPHASVRARWFQSLLVTCFLCLGLAPRSQVLKALVIGTTFTKHADDQKWWVSLLASMSKNGRPVLFSLPDLLTPIIDAYIATVRPRLLVPAAADSSEPADHMYLFVKFNGSPRTDFSSLTSAVTQYIIGRPVNAHAFRSAVMYVLKCPMHV